MRLILLGAPGTGKGTQGALLEKEFMVSRISTGDMFRAAISGGTEIGLKAQSYMNEGKLVPDDVVMGIVKERLTKPDMENGFLLDGFPRTVGQAEALAVLLDEIDATLDKAMLIDVGEEHIVKRLTGRRNCKNCSLTYNLVLAPAKWENSQCSATGDKCELIQRSDDKQEVVENRLHVYNSETSPLIEYYSERGLLAKVDGYGSVEEVFERIRKAL